MLFGLPLRAAQGLVGSLLRLMGLDWPVPHSSTLSRRQRDVTVVIPYRPRGEPLQLVVDRTGVKVLGDLPPFQWTRVTAYAAAARYNQPSPVGMRVRYCRRNHAARDPKRVTRVLLCGTPASH